MRRRAVYPLVLLLALAAAGIWGRQFARESPERLPGWMQEWPSVYLDLALKHIRASAITAGDVDWNAVAEAAHQAARNASTTADTYPAIRAALAQVGEDVGQIEPPATDNDSGGGVYGLQALFPDRVVAIVYPGSPAAAAGIRPGDIIERVEGRDPAASPDPRTRGQFVDLPRPRVTLTLRRGTDAPFDASLSLGGFRPFPAQAGRIGADLGFVAMPAVAADAGFVRQVREAIAAADDKAICGWVIDLRRTNGGAFWPLLQAVRPILGEATLGGWTDRDGQVTPWVYPSDAGAPPAPAQHAEPAIAVLTSRITANAGEMASVAFRGRPRTRVFGEPTWGSPANRTRIGMPDGATLVLASALATDRTGRPHAGRIRPDEPVTIDWSQIGTPDDKVMVAAATWLRSTAGCRNPPRK